MASAQASRLNHTCDGDGGFTEMAKKQILVVDDEKDIVEFLTQLLEDNGYEVTSANDGLAAMKLVEAKKPDDSPLLFGPLPSTKG